MAETRLELHIARPPEAVFDVIADPGRNASWMKACGVLGTALVAGQAGRPGARYEQRFRMGRREESIIVVITAHERPRAFAFECPEDRMFRIAGRYTLEPDGEGTRVRYVESTAGRRWIASLMLRLTAGMRRRFLDKDFAALKALLEGP